MQSCVPNPTTDPFAFAARATSAGLVPAADAELQYWWPITNRKVVSQAISRTAAHQPRPMRSEMTTSPVRIRPRAWPKAFMRRRRRLLPREFRR